MNAAPREWRTRYFDAEGARICHEIFLARNIQQAVAFARKRAPAGAVKVRVGRYGEGKWEGPVLVKADAA
ncbi:hypothetical protein [Parvibaculum sp.]|uniref:hypothetical protein n=1 Tax=Parvibaculum sp. TaxID=2024848 RepID=UPI00262830D1|nr:hypothetical protein [Parvibaculum sp.]MCW5728141.1 hypothetical protein [Parvibaculum sp.]